MMKRRPAAWESQPQEVAAAEQSAEERRLSLPVAGTTRGGWGSRQQRHGRPKWSGAENFPAAAQREACWRRRKNEEQRV